MKTKFVILLSKILIKIFTLLGGGSDLGGKIALMLDKGVLCEVTKGLDIILVTGTNGKTTTSSMISQILRKDGKRVVNNSTGANLKSGITSCFIKSYRFFKKNEGYGVIETDEAYLKHITKEVKPKAIVVTNIFRDQLDRYGEVDKTLELILQGIENAPECTLVLNGDEPLLCELSVKNKCVYYGFDAAPLGDAKIFESAESKFCKKCKTPYEYEFLCFNHLGKFSCPNCGFKRPLLDTALNEIVYIKADSSKFLVNGEEFLISQAGLYNIYNALSAICTAKTFGVSSSVIKEALLKEENKFGRQEIIKIGEKELVLILIKNPAGADEAIKTVALDKERVGLGVLLSDNLGDGTDVSWIWDAKFEELSQMDYESVIAGGIRAYDMAVRLKVSGISKEAIEVFHDWGSIISKIKEISAKKVYMLTTYTQMISFRKYLSKKGYAPKIW